MRALRSADAPAAPLGDSPRALAAGEVHLWHVLPRVVGAAALSVEELSRAAAIRCDEQRAQYVRTRVALREVLAGYLRCEPRHVALAYGRLGKPALAGQAAASGLAFSVSHGRSRSVVAVARDAALGVDVEPIVAGGRALEVAERLFAAGEVAALRALAPAERLRAFTATWTRKEAYVKALGLGLTLPLAAFEVSAHPRGAAVVRCAAADERPPEAWSMVEAAVAGHVCTVAVAADAPGARIRACEWIPARPWSASRLCA